MSETTAVLVSVPELIDLAVGPPELNVRLLNALLHVLCAQLTDLAAVRVQFTSPAAAVACLQATPRHALAAETLRVFSVADAPADGQLPDLGTCTLRPLPPPAVQPVQTLVVVEQQLLPPASKRMARDIVEASIPDTRELISSARTGSERPLVKMLDLLNLTKRCEAAELAVEQLTRLICRQRGAAATATSNGSARDGDAGADAETVKVSGGGGGGSESQMLDTDKYDEQLQSLNEWRTVVERQMVASAAECAALAARLDALAKEQRSVARKHDGLESLVETQRETVDRLERWTRTQMGVVSEPDLGTDSDSEGGGGVLQLLPPPPPPNSIPAIIARLAYIEEHCCNAANNAPDGGPTTTAAGGDAKRMSDGSLAGAVGGGRRGSCAGADAEKLLAVVRLADQHTRDIETLRFERDVLEQTVRQAIRAAEVAQRNFDRLQQVVCKVQNDVNQLVCSMEDVLVFAEHTRARLLDHVERMDEMRTDVGGLNVDVNMLVQERTDRWRQYEALIDQLEQIKCVKADREEVEEMVAVKADIVDMRTKVSYVHFADVTQDLSLAVIDALEKIVATDGEWHRAVDALLQQLGDKVERTEAAEQAVCLHDKLVALRDKVRAFAMFRLSCESAATEQQYLKAVKCIVCNAQTYMRAEETLPEITRLERFGRRPPAEAQEFGRVTVPCCKRQTIAVTATVQRFCGGRHTRTVAAERTSRKGDFVVQTGGVPLGPDLMNSLRGTDGVLYRTDVNRCDCKAAVAVVGGAEKPAK